MNGSAPGLVPHDQPHPRSDVVVVGAGVIGSAVALALARAGNAVTVLDPRPGGGASGGNAGLVVPSYCLPPPTTAELREAVRLFRRRDSGVALRAPLGLSTLGFLGRLVLQSRLRGSPAAARRLHAMAGRSLELYQALAAQGVIEIDPEGWLWPCREEATWRGLLARASHLERLGVRVERLSGADAQRQEPALGQTPWGALRFPQDAVVDPERLHRALLTQARGHGARFVGRAVVGPLRRAGELTGVRTQGDAVEARHVVLAAGATSRRVGRTFGVRLPVEPGYGWSLTLPAAGHSIVGALNLVEDHIVVTPRPDSIRLSTGMELGGPRLEDARPEALQALRDKAERWLPSLRDLAAGVGWRGARPMTASGLPIVRTSRRHPNLHVATGHGTLGVTLAAVTGEIVTDRVALVDAGEHLRAR